MNENSNKKRNILKYVGDFSQIFGIKEYIYSTGKSKGIKAFDFRNGSGLEFTVIADRCLDFSNLSFNGINCSYLSKTGIVSPNFYAEDDKSFLRNFYGGFLTTCGLRNVGSSCMDEGDFFGLHGRISNTPAEELCSHVEWIDDTPVLTLSGKVQESAFFGENLILHRKIMCRYGENKIHIQNTIENAGFRKEPLFVLFHFNFGYPLLDEDAVLISPTEKLIPYNERSLKGIENYNKFQAPTHAYSEQVFYHHLRANTEDETCVALINNRLELGVALRFDQKQFTNFTQWKQMGESEYVVGLEPGNCKVDGRAKARKERNLQYLEPGECKKFDIVIEIVNGTDKIKAIEDEIRRIGI